MTSQNNSLYYYIYTQIKHQILNGSLVPGDKLPSESELERIYKASKAPIRQALAMLEQEAYLVRYQGRGAFVCDRKKESHWLLSSGFAKDIEKNLNDISSKTLWVRTEIPIQGIRDILDLRSTQSVIHIHRLRYLKNIPVFSIDNFVRDSLNIEIFKAAGDFFIISEVFERDLRINLFRAEEEISATVADAITAKELQVAEGFPLLDIRRVYYTEAGKTEYVSRYQVRTDYWKHKATYYAKD